MQKHIILLVIHWKILIILVEHYRGHLNSLLHFAPCVTSFWLQHTFLPSTLSSRGHRIFHRRCLPGYGVFTWSTLSSLRYYLPVYGLFPWSTLSSFRYYLPGHGVFPWSTLSSLRYYLPATLPSLLRWPIWKKTESASLAKNTRVLLWGALLHGPQWGFVLHANGVKPHVEINANKCPSSPFVAEIRLIRDMHPATARDNCVHGRRQGDRWDRPTFRHCRSAYSIN